MTTAPTEFTAESRNQGVVVSWTPPEKHFGDPVITGYQITATRGDKVRTYALPADQTEAELGGLENCPDLPPAYADAVMALSPLWYYRFENTTSNVDSSGHGWTWNTGYAGSTDVPGLYPSSTNRGRARSFTGAAGGGQLNVTGVTGERSATCAAAVQHVSAGGESIVASVCGPIAGGHSIMFGFHSDGKPFIHCYGGGVEKQLFGPTSLSGTGTHHMVWRWDKVTFDVDIWVDGVKIAHGNNGGPIRPGTGWRQVCDGNGRVYRGVLDEVSWFDAALTDTQVAALYESWAGGQ
jgi:Concanavalin A-like lectin/glucanases superfamily